MPDALMTMNRTDIAAAIEDALSGIALQPLVSGVAYGERLTFEQA